MGQPTQRATNCTARSNIDTAQIFLHANGHRPNRAMIRQRSRRRQRRGVPHTEHGLGVLRATALAQHISHSHSGIDEKRPTVKFVEGLYILQKGVYRERDVYIPSGSQSHSPISSLCLCARVLFVYTPSPDGLYTRVNPTRRFR